MSPEKDASFVSMINSIKDDLTSLVNSHIELAQAEAKESVGRIAKSSGLFITAIAMLNLAIVFVFIAAAYYINTLGFELWVSFLFVVGGLTFGAVFLGLLAKRQASKITFGTKTAKSVTDTVNTISNLRPGSK
ncbi:MAG: phage holin family protein [Actinobacteria bacterium]|jgi:Flp pilus assembly protein TadB|nr:phage holin family protein [Actinomycetota bacterium]